jgi:hypothetical protein
MRKKDRKKSKGNKSMNTSASEIKGREEGNKR